MKLVNLLLCAALASTCAFGEDATTFDAATLKGVTAKDPCAYAVGEKILFTFSLDGAPADDAMFAPLRLKWKLRGDDGTHSEGEMPLKRDGMKVETSLSRPGFVHVEAWVADADGKKLRRAKPSNASCTGRDEITFTGGAGVAIDKIKQGANEPPDFNERWKTAIKRLLKENPVNAKTIGGYWKDESDGLYFRCLAVEVPSAGPGWSKAYATGYLTMPKDAKPGTLKARVSFDGYGIYKQGRPPFCDGEWIDLHVNAHGIRPLTLDGEDFEAFKREKIEARGMYAFNEEDNEDFEKAYFFGMAMRAISATAFMREFLKTCPEWDGKTFMTTGGSQGGLQATWAAAFVKGVSALRIHVPWCCDLGGTEAGRMGGWRPRFTNALCYFDPVNVAKRLRPDQEKTIFRSALGDYIAPPSTHAVLFNAMRGKKEIEFRQGGDHYDDPKSYSQIQGFSVE